MQIGAQIKRHRAELALSQDGLAAKVYVSRQTISSWETGKTYPDVQSLLLLSEIFGVTVDDLVKGDLDTMSKTIDSDVALMNRLGLVMMGFLLLMIACLVWLTVQMTVWDWGFAQTAPTILLALTMWGVAMFAAVWAERIKRNRDLVTYHEVLAFFRGEPVDRDTERGRRAHDPALDEDRPHHRAHAARRRRRRVRGLRRSGARESPAGIAPHAAGCVPDRRRPRATRRATAG